MDIPQETDVVVIGAGIAGLAAAHWLYDAGLKPEQARDRIGGRICTQLLEAGGHLVPVDLGASWVHGIDGNPLMDLMEGDSIDDKRRRHLSCSSPGNYWLTAHAPDERLFYYDKEIEPTLKDSYIRLFERFMGDIRRMAQEQRLLEAQGRGTPLSLQDGVDWVIQQHIAGDVNGMAKQILRFELFKHELWMASDLARLHLAEWADESNWGHYPGAHCIIRDGYQTILQPLLNGLQHRVFLNQEVVQVKFDATISENGRNMTITTRDGKTIKSKVVLCTLPFGVWKKVALENQDIDPTFVNLNPMPAFFQPPLSEKKLDSLKHLDIGVYNKVVLLFERPFWSTSTTEAGTDGEHFIGCVTNDPINELSLFLDYYRFKRVPILVAFTFNKLARKLETMSNEEVQELAMNSIRKMFPTAPNPIKVTVTRWGSDPYSLGSYCYLPIDATLDHIKELSVPEADSRLYFAGEGCSWEHQGSVHGGYLSGIQQAKALYQRWAAELTSSSFL